MIGPIMAWLLAGLATFIFAYYGSFGVRTQRLAAQLTRPLTLVLPVVLLSITIILRF